MKKLRSCLLVVLMALSLVACSPKQTASGIKDGTFAGEGTGKNDKISVEVTFKDSKIEGINIISEKETPGYSDAMVTLSANMLAKNQIDVDTVTGATFTSNGFIEAVKDAFSKTGSDISALVAVDGEVKSDRADAYTSDVIIVGAGGAGLSAAISAAEAGAKVIIIEKMPMVGGNTLISGAEMAAPGNWLQEKEKIEDSKDKFFDDVMKGGDNESDPALVRVLADSALDAAEWLRDDVKVIFEDYMLFFGGHSVKRSLVPLNASGVELITKLEATAKALGVEIHTNTPAKEFIEKDGKIVGVKAEYNGKEVIYNANNGVILASGGFGSNLEMRVKYNPAMDEKILSTNTVGSMGDGITMAEKINAHIVDMPFIQTYPTCDPEHGTLLYVGDVRLDGRSILVNKEGKRFVEELERRDVISSAVVAQTGGVSYMFWDEASMIASKVNVKHKAEYDNLIERGILVKADTLEAAATFFEIDAKELQNTVNKYNEYATNGKDLEFNKRGELTAFSDGPYYIMKSIPAIHHTMGGVKINTDAQVLDIDGKIIKGLYAAGEVTGDIHGTNRLGSDAIADIVVFGRIAGENAAASK